MADRLVSYDPTKLAGQQFAPGPRSEIEGIVESAVGDANLDYLTKDEANIAYGRVWAAGETVTAGTVRLSPSGLAISRIADGTTRPSYDATEAAQWSPVAAAYDVGSAAWILRNESDFRFLTITYDTTYPQAISSATGKWPDGTAGTWTATSIDPPTQQVLGYTLTYAPAGGTTKTLTQGARTLNSAGATTSAPMPTVA